MTALPVDTELEEGEHLVTSFCPSLISFAQRAILLGFATALGLGGVGWLNWYQSLVVLPILSLLYIFVFDDLSAWIRHRNDTWHLTDRRLIYERKGAPEDNAAVYLGDITDMRLWFWWGLRIGLCNGHTTTMKYVSGPSQIRARIAGAKSVDAAQRGTREHA
ncbi:MAG: hypothetical protein CSA70_00595 [Rhodobacterales bacterium]|nr:MAG: hypothetical protein CSA70_00595 [Rhodobacterales bacterium]